MAGVARQYSSTTERVENCQVGFCLAYTGARGYTLPDSELYLPEGWTNEPTPAQWLQGLVRPGPAGTGTKWAALHFHYRRQQATTLL